MNFLEICKKYNDKIAVVFENKSLCYGELDFQSSKIAEQLKKLGVKKNDNVAIKLSQNINYISAIFGVWKVGAAYVPLGVNTPFERAQKICDDCNVSAIIDESFLVEAEKLHPLGQRYQLGDNAISIYTSGSTGTPKGVSITHKQLEDFFKNIDSIIKIENDTKFLSINNYTFSLHTLEVLYPLFKGLTIYIANQDEKKDIYSIENFVEKNEISIACFTPQILKLLGENSKCLKTVFTTGEQLYNISQKNYKIFNIYGTTETLALAAFEIDGEYQIAPIGKPIGKKKLYILDEDGKSKDYGELYAEENFVSGYINSHKDTEKYFVKKNGKNLFKTGDIARVSQNGQYTIVGRIDDMVKINGQRVEFAEIEENIRIYEKVEEVVVKAYTDDFKQNFLCAYFTANKKVSTQELKDFLSTKLNSYMIPQYFIWIKEFELNENGKIDKSLLEKPDPETYKENYVAATDDLQAEICKAFGTVLGLEEVGIDDNFFTLGGDSIKVLYLLKLIQKYNLSPKDIFEAQTPREISAFIESGIDIKNSQEKLSPQEKLDVYPTTDSEFRIFSYQEKEPSSTKYNIPAFVKIPKSTKITAEETTDAIKKTVNLHQSLKVNFELQNGELVKFKNNIDFEIQIKQTSFDSAVREFIKPFNLKNELLFRFLICETPDTYYLIFDIHHIIIDGISMSVLMNEFKKILCNEEIELETINNFDYAIYEKNLKEKKQYKIAQNFFETHFSESDEETTLLSDIIDDSTITKANQVDAIFNKNLAPQNVQLFTKENALTENTLFTSAFAYCLSKFTNSDEVIFNTMSFGRHNPEVSDTIGLFSKIVPLKFAPVELTTISEFLKDAQNYLSETFSNDIYNFSEITKKLKIKGKILFAYQAEILKGFEINENKFEIQLIPNKEVLTDLTCQIFKYTDFYKITITYNNKIYSEEYIKAFTNFYRQVISEMLVKERLCDIELVSKGDAGILDAYNNAKMPINPNFTILDMFNKQVSLTPKSTALVYGGRRYTYSALNTLADNLAIYLRSIGLNAQDKAVSVLMKRSEYFVIAALAIAKAGGVYVPIDIAFPKERIKAICAHSNSKFIILDQELEYLIPDFEGKKIYTSEIKNIPPSENMLSFNPVAEDLFAILYTSGSTGEPKGVMLEHRNIANFSVCYAVNKQISSQENSLACANIAFDAHILEIFPYLITGATVYIADEETISDFDKLDDYIKKNRISNLMLTTQLGKEYVKAHPYNQYLKSLTVGGERLLPFDKLPNYAIYNIYGPTEATVFVTSHKVSKNEKTIPIGKPSGNTSLYITDKYNRRLPLCAIGELQIAGLNITKGYLNNSEETNKKFIKNNFERTRGYETIYKTGDICRYLPDGNIDFLYRNDNQVKINGHRIELEEIENQICKYQDIKNAVVLVEEQGYGKKLVAFYTADKEINQNELIQFLKNSLPYYMIPQNLTQLDAIPYTTNGKIDKKALLNTEKHYEIDETTLTDIQKKLVDILANILGHKDFSLETNLISAGLTSITAIKFAADFIKEFNIEISSFELFDECNILSLEQKILNNNEEKLVEIQELEEIEDIKDLEEREIIEEKVEETEIVEDIEITDDINQSQEIEETEETVGQEEILNSDTANIEENNIQEQEEKEEEQEIVEPVEKIVNGLVQIPLSATQLGVYLDCAKNPQNHAYNIPIQLKTSKDIDIENLTKSLYTVLSNHNYINTHLEFTNEGIVQVINPKAEPQIEYKELSEEDYEQLKNIYSSTPFDLFKAPLYKCSIIKTENYVYILFCIHHIIFDGASETILLKELANLYSNVEPEKEFFSYIDYVKEERKNITKDSFQSAENFFKEMLKTFKTTSKLKTDVNLPEEQGQLEILEKDVNIDVISKFCKDYSFTPASLFLAATLYTISRYTSEDDVFISTIFNGRNDLRLQNTIGMFVKTLPFGCQISKDKNCLGFIKQVSKILQYAAYNDIFPYSEIVEKYNYKTNIMFECQLGVIENIKLGEYEVENKFLNIEKTKFPISVNIVDTKDGIGVRLVYNNALYTEKTINNFLESVVKVVETMAENPLEFIDKISILSEAQEKQLKDFRISQFEKTEIPFIHEMFAKQAKASPQKTILTTSDGNFTYKQLDENSNKIANALIEKGLEIEDRVLVLLPRTSKLFTSIFGILKAGGTFIPCDIKQPTTRIKAILEDSNVKYVITTKDMLSCFTKTEAIAVEDLLKTNNIALPERKIGKDNLAYIIYTSGSTSTPKGVMVEHESLANALTPNSAMKHLVAVKEKVSVYASITSVAFDMSFKEHLFALCNSVKLVVPSDEITKDATKLAQVFKAEKVDGFNSATSRLEQFTKVEEFKDVLKDFKVVIFGGEKVSENFIKKLRNITLAKLFNTYGPTETTISSNVKEFITGNEPVSVGKPLTNYVEFIVDKDGNELPVGVVGELYIGGYGVSRGYNNLDALTEKQYRDFKGLRVYKTGDLASWNKDGEIVIHGRIDKQIKLRGFRIDLEEIENEMLKINEINQACVTLGKLNEEDAICAYFTANDKINPQLIKAELKKSIADYMVPIAYLQMSKFPLNENGKIDCSNLPQAYALRENEHISPKTKIQADFCKIFAAVLGIDDVGIKDNFFDIGGTSLSVIKILVEAQKLGYELNYGEVFINKTPENLANLIESDNENTTLDEEVDSFDYTKIDNVLFKNNLVEFQKNTMQDLGDILITGATQHLGINMLFELLTKHDCNVYCIEPKNKDISAIETIKQALNNNFGRDFSEALGKRLFIREGNIEDVTFLEKVKNLPVNTVFNFKESTNSNNLEELENTNYNAVCNLINYCIDKNCKLIQISTANVAGLKIANETKIQQLSENDLYIEQTFENEYIKSKFKAEQAILEAVAEKNLNAKIMRLDNIISNNIEAALKSNYTNSLFKKLKTYTYIKAFPFSKMNLPISISALEDTLQAILELSKTPKTCIVLHPFNNHTICLGDIIAEMIKEGIEIRILEDADFKVATQIAQTNEDINEILKNTFSLQSQYPRKQFEYNKKTCDYTCQLLYRQGFKWNILEKTCIENIVNIIKSE
ncbi:MAG: amino acid adenylation domain-containing protein [bacterium]|nr:amino acid adenylation domain-containing protein [bacterium]